MQTKSTVLITTVVFFLNVLAVDMSIILYCTSFGSTRIMLIRGFLRAISNIKESKLLFGIYSYILAFSLILEYNIPMLKLRFRGYYILEFIETLSRTFQKSFLLFPI
ncbi:hypothetical protein MLD38_036453 [Melastoma candidum]|uniref:Uncharacterized protein n=1 Tax=Melastoma candidum TaxID=119954 RepID=A0ACB9LKG5_9MYRT|nr:hypothetical protein MLD38_036453 [Melastoma candidum]